MEDNVGRPSNRRTAFIALAVLAAVAILSLFLLTMTNAYAENAPTAGDVGDAYGFGVGTNAAVGGQPEATSKGAVESGLMVISEDGVSRYSTDGGVTWIEGLPEDSEIRIDEQGRTILNVDGVNGVDGSSSEIGGFAVSCGEDGVTRYSTDGGETWSESVPEGVRITEGSDGVTTVTAESAALFSYQSGSATD
jgi:hypothetical protein